jgi:uncharacterized BrkB/YihY/UPF0761 family membrane protein
VLQQVAYMRIFVVIPILIVLAAVSGCVASAAASVS